MTQRPPIRAAFVVLKDGTPELFPCGGFRGVVFRMCQAEGPAKVIEEQKYLLCEHKKHRASRLFYALTAFCKVDFRARVDISVASASMQAVSTWDPNGPWSLLSTETLAVAISFSPTTMM